MWIKVILLGLLGGLLACGEPEKVGPEPLPRLALYAKTPIDKEDKGPGELTVREGRESFTVPMAIERRGGYSMRYDKHSYAIELNRDTALLGLPADDDWIINAGYVDKTFLRHKLAYDLFREMDSTNLAPRCRYAEVSLNGRYDGLYVLMQKVDKSMLALRDSAAFLFKEPHVFRRTYDGVVAQRADNFHQQKFPKRIRADRSPVLEELRELILTASDERFRAEIGNYVDLTGFIDWHLLLLITNNQDGVLKNFYLYRAGGEAKMRVVPWDYDHSFGRDGDGERNDLERLVDVRRNILFDRLLTDHPAYVRALYERWKAHNLTGVLSVEGLQNRIRAGKQEIAPYVAKNFARWPADSRWYYDAASFEEEIDVMQDFVIRRHAQVQSELQEAVAGAVGR